MNVLNLYAGIGGNRYLWGNEHNVTAVECDCNIAKIYQDLFPDDKVIIGDAHKYLLVHYKEFDFIWSSPPCITHSILNFFRFRKDNLQYPDMSLYQEILLLQRLYKGMYCVENVKPYYKPLIKPTITIDRHIYWASKELSFMGYIPSPKKASINPFKQKGEKDKWINRYQFPIKNWYGVDKRKVLRNVCDPNDAKWLFDNLTNERDKDE